MVSSVFGYPKIAMVWLILLLSPLLHMCLILFPAHSAGVSRIRNLHSSSLGRFKFCPCALKENRIIFFQCQIAGSVDKDIWKTRELMCLLASKPLLEVQKIYATRCSVSDFQRSLPYHKANLAVVLRQNVHFSVEN